MNDSNAVKNGFAEKKMSLNWKWSESLIEEKRTPIELLSHKNKI